MGKNLLKRLSDAFKGPNKSTKPNNSTSESPKPLERTSIKEIFKLGGYDLSENSDSDNDDVFEPPYSPSKPNNSSENHLKTWTYVYQSVNGTDTVAESVFSPNDRSLPPLNSAPRTKFNNFFEEYDTSANGSMTSSGVFDNKHTDSSFKKEDNTHPVCNRHGFSYTNGVKFDPALVNLKPINTHNNDRVDPLGDNTTENPE